MPRISSPAAALGDGALSPPTAFAAPPLRLVHSRPADDGLTIPHPPTLADMLAAAAEDLAGATLLYRSDCRLLAARLQAWAQIARAPQAQSVPPALPRRPRLRDALRRVFRP